MKQKTALTQLKALQKNSTKMRLAAEEWTKNWQTLIATIMSARTNDYVTIPTANKLFQKRKTLKAIANSEQKQIEEIIKPVNFHKTKSKNIINCAKDLIGKHKSKTPLEFDELIKLPGVGRKTANVFLSELGGANIGVDTHVSQISQKLNWTKNSKPEKIENDLKKLFPKKYWRTINPILVRFGKTHTSRKNKNEILNEIGKLK